MRCLLLQNSNLPALVDDEDYTLEEEAAKAYDKAAFEAFGEFAVLNFDGGKVFELPVENKPYEMFPQT